MVTVIIPIYNVEKYLSKCLESVINQTYRDLEIILIDDGSTDNSGKICDRYDQKDDRIKVVHQTNGGLSAARNTGIDIATGQYITFIDSDDYVTENYIEILVKAAQTYNADLVSTTLVKVYPDQKLQLVKERPQIFAYSKEDVLKVYRTERQDQNPKFPTAACGKLYKKNLWETIRFPVGRLHEDEFTTYKIFDRIVVAAYVTGGGYMYLQHDKSIMHNKNVKNYEDTLDAAEEKIEFYYDREGEKGANYLHAISSILNYAFITLREIDLSYNIDLKKRCEKIIRHYRQFLNGKKQRIASVLYFVSPNVYQKLARKLR